MVEFPPGFQWDPAKSGRCLAERGFDFAYAARLWDGPVRAAEDARRNYGEARMKALGVIEGRYFVVVFTWRGQIDPAHYFGPARAWQGGFEMGRIVRKTVAAAGGGLVDYARLDATTEEDIRRQMIEDGEDPDADENDWHPCVMQVRQALNLTQTEIAAMLGMPVATWRNWEQGRTAIDAPGRALLWVLAREPDAVLRAMRHNRAA